LLEVSVMIIIQRVMVFDHQIRPSSPVVS